jgi:hypothetical protein
LGKLFVVPAGALPVPVSERPYRAKHPLFSGQSSLTALPGRQHNCFPTALVTGPGHWHPGKACHLVRGAPFEVEAGQPGHNVAVRHEEVARQERRRPEDRLPARGQNASFVNCEEAHTIYKLQPKNTL